MLSLAGSHALNYALRGWKVHPCREHDGAGFKAKSPYLPHGFKDASNDPATVVAWWQRWPNALIGLPVPEGLIVLDIDPRDGGRLEDLEKLAGGPLPDTMIAESGGADKGRHYWFRTRTTGLRHKGLPKGIDLREGGRAYVIAPPSLHPDTGEPYQWVSLAPVAPVPPGIMQVLAPPVVTPARQPRPARTADRYTGGAVTGIVRVMSEAVTGERNRTLFWCACRMAERDRDGKPADWDALTTEALRAGLSDLEVARTIDSAKKTIGANA